MTSPRALVRPDRSRSPRRQFGSQVEGVKKFTGQTWRPVTEWEAICYLSDAGGKSEEARWAREIMTRSVCHLARDGREILYAADFDSDRKWYLTLALHNTRERKSWTANHDLLWTDSMRNDPMSSVQNRYNAWVEAAVDIVLHFEKKGVYISYFTRDTNAPKGTMRVDDSDDFVDVAKVLMCFAMAMSLEIFALTLPVEEVQNIKVKLNAADTGTGRLFSYYQREYGLKQIHKNPKYMLGTLSRALRLCVADWKEQQKCALASCAKPHEGKSSLLQAITSWKARQAQRASEFFRFPVQKVNA